MRTITAKSASFARRSKKSVGTYPFYVPRAAFGGPEVKVVRKGERRRKAAA